MGRPMYEESIRDEFTHQSDSFARAPVMSSAETLGALVELVPVEPKARWLEVACGPAAISRALAGRVGSVHGVDLTPAMVAKAGEEATREGIANAEFSVGDATALGFAEASFDGAVTRFSLHHIPAPQRVLEDMARVVRPGGWVIVGDHVTDADGDAAAWHEEIERLRDPSHWACLTPDRLRALGEAAGLELDLEELIPFDLDFGEWLGRGSGGASAAPLIESLLGRAPETADSFRVVREGDGRRLALHNSLSRWRRP
jgi:SAM-dependent methyltransferase